MALYHKATITPSKPELVATWAPSQLWFPTGATTEVVGAFRFEDPEGQVGIETHLVLAGDTLLQVPFTYRNAPLDEVGEVPERGFVGTTEHSALGTRWVYDGLADERYLMMLAGAAMTGQGEALGMVVYDGRWHIAPSNVRLTGGGWTAERVAVDGFEAVAGDSDGAGRVLLRNEGFELSFFRRPTAMDRPPMGLVAQLDAVAAPVLLAVVTER